MPRTMITVLATLTLVVVACSEDTAGPQNNTPPPSDYQDLTEINHVLSNLVVAYEDRNIDRYSEIFDADFVFHFSPGDVGGEVPSQWSKAEELASAGNMFNGGGESPIIDIELNLSTAGASWEDYTSPEFPGETLKRMTGVVYDFKITTSVDLTFITSGAPEAQFIAREVDGKWKLVEWFDLPDGAPAFRSPASGTEESSWSTVKALYQGE